MPTITPNTSLVSNSENELFLLRQAVEATRGALIITDNQQDDNPIIYANKAFLELTGYTAGEVIGKNCRFLQGTDTEATPIDTLRQAVKSGKEARVTVRNYRKDGSLFWNDLLMSPIKDETGTVTHFIGMQVNVTERVEHERALAEGQERLRRSNQELEQFTYAASHDLQEPLRMVRSFVQLIEQRYGDKLDDDGKSFINFAVEGATRMQTLVNDLLLLSRVRSRGRSAKPVALNKPLDAALGNLMAGIRETDAAIDFEADLPTVCGDEAQLAQLFQNLIGNALKYHRPKVKPHITIKVVDGGDDRYEVLVGDNGIGIDPQYFERIFGVFQRLHTREEYPGTGVGLAICQKIVERQGGKLWVESKPGKGSVFHFTIAAADAEATR